jgi:hypothetical protein
MNNARPENGDPVSMQRPPRNMGTIMVRFIGLLLAAVVVLALIWSR